MWGFFKFDSTKNLIRISLKGFSQVMLIEQCNLRRAHSSRDNVTLSPSWFNGASVFHGRYVDGKILWR